MLRALLLAFAALAAAPATAQTPVVSAAPDHVAVTLYRAPGRAADEAMQLGWLRGYALVTEQRTVTIPAGRATIRFEGVAGGMLPESALVTGLPAGVREKNLDAELLSPGSLFAHGFGRPVILRRTNKRTGQVSEEPAVIRSAPGGAGIVQTRDGLEAINCGPFAEAPVYSGMPEGLSARPTLSVETDSPAATTVTLTLSYLAWGFDWQANYVVRMHKGGRSADLTAWVTLANGDPTSFADADTAVVAGEVHRESERDGGEPRAEPLIFSCFAHPITVQENYAASPPPVAAPEAMEIVVTGARIARRTFAAASPITVVGEELGDLKLYRVPIPTTVASNAQKQIAMYDKPGIKAWPYFAAQIDADGGNVGAVTMMLRVRNRSEDGLGVALPAGPVATFEPLNGESMLVGEGYVPDKAIGEDVEINIAPATQVTAESANPASGDQWQDYAVTVRNANPWPIAFEASLFVNDGSQVLENVSAKLGRRYGRPLWQAQVPANGTAVLRYRLRNTR